MKILIVDDEPVANFIIIRLLSSISKEFEIADYTKPVDAINALPTINPDVIFLDLNMPDMNGWAFLDRMQQDNLKHPVYILTSSVSSVDLERAKDYGQVLECLAKPVTKDKLKACIDRVSAM